VGPIKTTGALFQVNDFCVESTSLLRPMRGGGVTHVSVDPRPPAVPRAPEPLSSIVDLNRPCLKPSFFHRRCIETAVPPAGSALAERLGIRAFFFPCPFGRDPSVASQITPLIHCHAGVIAARYLGGRPPLVQSIPPHDPPPNPPGRTRVRLAEKSFPAPPCSRPVSPGPNRASLLRTRHEILGRSTAEKSSRRARSHFPRALVREPCWPKAMI